MQFSNCLVAFTSLLALTSAAPMTTIETRAAKQYFAVTNFSWAKTTQTSSYSFNVTFPQYVQISNVPADQPIYVIPALKDPVTCTGTWTRSSNSSCLTTVNTCTQPKSKYATVKAQLDVTKGQLFLTYSYNVSINGQMKNHVYTGNQTSLSPVDARRPSAFNVTVTAGPGVSN